MYNGITFIIYFSHLLIYYIIYKRLIKILGSK